MVDVLRYSNTDTVFQIMKERAREIQRGRMEERKTAIPSKTETEKVHIIVYKTIRSDKVKLTQISYVNIRKAYT